jgi:hypothetical protein
MLKITSTVDSRQSVILRLEGRLVADWVPELMTVCRSDGQTSRCEELDIGSLSFADAAGIEALRNLADQGLRITNGSPFMAELLRENRK